MRFEADGSVAVTVGTFSHGQGHETAYAQILHQKLGVDLREGRLIQGDTAVVEQGNGTGGSRSSQMGGVAIARARRSWSSPRGGGWRRICWKPASTTWSSRAAASASPAPTCSTGWEQVIELAQSPPEGEAPGLDEQLLYTRSTECNFPNGCHVAEVEIDADTGQVEIVRYAAVDDVGNVINPMLVHGQSHGGIMSGIGQALLEHAVYDRESGQFLTATFQDYCMPRAMRRAELRPRLQHRALPEQRPRREGRRRGRRLRRAAGHRLGDLRCAGGRRISTCR